MSHLANHDVLAIGASAGGFNALKFLTRELDPDLPAAILVVVHLRSDFQSNLAELLDRGSSLRVTFAKDGETIVPRHVYLAPPDRHLLLREDGTLSLSAGARENHSRPAIDPLFRSVAVARGSRAIGLVLTGYLSDGTSGLLAIKAGGGITMVQDPADATHPDMPRSAMEAVKPEHVVPLAAMPALLGRLVRSPAGSAVPLPEEIKLEAKMAANEGTDIVTLDRIGRRTLFVCPECHGNLWEIEESGTARYRCYTGHAFSAEALDQSFHDDLGRALATALRALDERARLLRRMEEKAVEDGRPNLARQWGDRAADFETEADVVRNTLARSTLRD
jgi:two-component system chemotaxis response regulator CheB